MSHILSVSHSVTQIGDPSDLKWIDGLEQVEQQQPAATDSITEDFCNHQDRS